MGRPRKLLNAQTGNLTVEEQERLKAEEEKLYNYEKLDFGYFPAGLLREAFPEWERISKIVGDLPLSELDQQTMVRYCNYSYLYSDVAEQVAYQGPITPEGKKNPLVDVMNSYSKELKAATSDLGLTINSRLKIVAPAEKEKEEEDPMGQMLNFVRKEG